MKVAILFQRKVAKSGWMGRRLFFRFVIKSVVPSTKSSQTVDDAALEETAFPPVRFFRSRLCTDQGVGVRWLSKSFEPRPLLPFYWVLPVSSGHPGGTDYCSPQQGHKTGSLLRPAHGPARLFLTVCRGE